MQRIVKVFAYMDCATALPAPQTQSGRPLACRTAFCLSAALLDDPQRRLALAGRRLALRGLALLLALAGLGLAVDAGEAGALLLRRFRGQHRLMAEDHADTVLPGIDGHQRRAWHHHLHGWPPKRAEKPSASF